MNSSSATDKPILSGEALSRPTAIVAVLLFLVPPAAWLISLGASYAVDDFVCTAAASADAAPPAAVVQTIVIVLNAVLLLVTLASGVLAFLQRRRSTRPGALMSFLSWTTVGSAALFGYGIVLIGVSAVVLEACS